MKALKLFMDTTPEDQPVGTYPFAKNGVQYDLEGSSFNEPGFRKLSGVTIPYIVNGVIETDKYPVIFSTDNTHSAIGLLDTDNEVYIPILNDATWGLVDINGNSEFLGFNTKYYITGESQRNYKGELVVSFTDKHTWPMFLNVDNPNISDVENLRLFPHFKPPIVVGKPISGGVVAAGAYYVAVGYEKIDGTSTPYVTISEVILVQNGSVVGVPAKAINITITGADTSYDFIRIAIISKINGVTNSVELTDYLPITTGVLNLIYTGSNLSSVVDTTQVLTPMAVYDRVNTIGQLNDYLYVGGLHSEPDFNDLQPYACAVQAEWVSSMVTPTAPTEDMLNGTVRGMMHQEVYGLYIRYRKTRGGFTKWFTIPGNTPTSDNLSASSEASTGGATTTFPKFQVEDTIPYFDPINLSGGTGVWKNTSELYPNTVDYDASGIGGRDLRGQHVLHHRMPSIRWCQKNLYPTAANYCKTDLDILNIRLINVRVPAKYSTLIDGYELGFALRTVGNMTVCGQSTMLHAAPAQQFAGSADGTTAMYTSGGNWHSNYYARTFDSNTGINPLRFSTFRIHAFDILFNKPSISPTFVSAQAKLYKGDLRNPLVYLEGGDLESTVDGIGTSTGTGGDGPIAFIIDYTQGDTPAPIAPGSYLRAISSSNYLTNNTNINNFINVKHENCFAGYMRGSDWVFPYGSVGMRAYHGRSTEADIGSPGFEYSYLVNLIATPPDVYSSFLSQSIVSAGLAKALTDGSVFLTGDTFASDYTFHTYGRFSSDDHTLATDTGIQCIKAIRRIVCESISNIALRYEVPGNIYSQWYPHNPTASHSPLNCYPIYFLRTQDPNQFGYTKDFNAVNDLVDQTIYSPFQEYLVDFPYRIHRGGKANRTNKPRSWRTFLPLDYYEMQKNMGNIIHLEGMDDRLIIHMQNAMFITQDKAKLDAGVLSITLGAGDIFQFQPQEATSSKLGYAGTRHDLACVRTPAGYIFCDAQLGEMYLFKGKLENLNAGINTFLRDALKIVANNTYVGNGITIGYDQKYKRILLTVKNLVLASGATPKVFVDTDAFWASLSVNDIVLYNGRLVKFKGTNTSSYNCPAPPTVHTITWTPTGPFCLQDSGAHNTGYRGWNTRARLTDGTLDGYTEANSSTTGIGPYFPPVLDLTDCALPTPTTTWQKASPACEHLYTQPAAVTSTGQTLIASTNVVYTSYKTRVYKLSASAYTETDIGPFTPTSATDVELTTVHQWVNTDGTTTDGPANRCGVFVSPGVGAGVQVTIPFVYNNTGAIRQVYIGVFGDNEFNLKFNGNEIAYTDGTSVDRNFKIFHVFAVTLALGTNYFNLVGTGTGGSSDSVGMIVYDNTKAQLSAATNDTTLSILFNSASLIGQTIDIVTCPAGWSLDTTGGINSCKLNTSIPPVGSGITDTGNNGIVDWATRCRYINSLPDGYCEANTAGGGNPYFPPEINTLLCPLTPPSGIICGANVSDTYAGNDYHAYPETLINITNMTGGLSLVWNSYDRPNRFTVKKDGTAILTTGWKGVAAYSGPWGTTLPQTVETGSLDWIPEAGHVYTILVEAGLADSGNPQSDSYNYSLICTN